MENGKKEPAVDKKRIFMFAIGAVCICALIAGIFFVQLRRTERKKAEEQKLVKEQQEKEAQEAKNAGNTEEKKEPYTNYEAFLEDVKKGVEDDFKSIAAGELDISPAFGGKITAENHILGYYLTDLDSDGVEELLLCAKDESWGTRIFDIYAMKDGLVSHVASGDSDTTLKHYYSLLENGMIKDFYSQYNVGNGKHDRCSHSYYTWQDGDLQFVEAVFSDEEGKGWFYSREGVTMENVEKKISWERWLEETREKGYSKQEFVLTPFIPIADTDDFADDENWGFEALEGKIFWFYSGVGAWHTAMKIHKDGTFVGEYTDADLEVLYKCNFSGRFTELEKTGPYEYTMKCKDLTLERQPQAEGVEENGHIVYYSDPYGFDDAEEFKVYLPGKKVNELADGFLSWSHEEAASDYLQCYGIYNVGGRQGFVEMKDMTDFEAEE